MQRNNKFIIFFAVLIISVAVSIFILIAANRQKRVIVKEDIMIDCENIRAELIRAEFIKDVLCIKVNFVNDAEAAMYYGVEYDVLVRDGENWKEVPLIELEDGVHWAWPDVLIFVNPGEERTETINLYAFDVSREGEYCLIKEFYLQSSEEDSREYHTIKIDFLVNR